MSVQPERGARCVVLAQPSLARLQEISVHGSALTRRGFKAPGTVTWFKWHMA